MRRGGGSYSYGGGTSARTAAVRGGGSYTTTGGGDAGDGGRAGDGTGSSGGGSGCSGSPAGAVCCWGAFAQNQLPGGHELPPAVCAEATPDDAITRAKLAEDTIDFIMARRTPSEMSLCNRGATKLGPRAGGNQRGEAGSGARTDRPPLPRVHDPPEKR